VLSNTSPAGYDAQVGLGFPLRHRLEAVLSVTHLRFPLDERAAFDENNKTTVWAVTADMEFGMLSPGRAVQLYISLGGGGYWLDAVPSRSRIAYAVGEKPASSVTGPCPPFLYRTGEQESLRAGLRLGVGARIFIAPRLRMFVQPTYTFIFTEDDSVRYLPLRAGLRFRS
jgi:hypothetical protein